MFESDRIRQWTPVAQVVWGVDGTAHLASQRAVAKMLRDAGVLSHIADGEPFRRVMFHGMVHRDGKKMSKHLGNTVNPDDLIERYGADTLRLTVLYAAAPRNDFFWNVGDIEYCHSFLARLWRYGLPRLEWADELGIEDGYPVTVSCGACWSSG